MSETQCLFRRGVMGALRQAAEVVKEPLWLMTFLNGCVNSLALLCFGQTVTHHTGNVTKLAQTLFAGEMKPFLILLGIILSYFFGTVLSGLFYVPSAQRRRQRAGVEVGLLGVLTLVSSLALGKSLPLVFPLAFVSGAQNGMYLVHEDLLLRFTHMTGYLTDAAFALSGVLRRDKKAGKRLIIIGMHLFLFWLGAALGYGLSLMNKGNPFIYIGMAQIFTGLSYLWGERRKSARGQ